MARIFGTPRVVSLAVPLAFARGMPALAGAHITRIEITRVESPTFEGTAFADVGPYEKLVGRAFGDIDPNDPHNRTIADIALAPRNERGMVEYSMDIHILRPAYRFAGNRRILFDINNRGNNFSFGPRSS